ncbi:MAG: transferrin-binding protein-like solute binding protein [Sphingomonadaceae bacterium]|nr:transferrin-binding protein-like solute binding protein [Sphingomonadaceae bacterium]
MRLLVLLASTSLLAACGGGGPQTISSAPSPPTGGGIAGGGTANTEHSFANPTQAKTYTGIGGNQVYDYSTDDRFCCNQQAQIYAGNTTTVRDSSISISYDPADAIYELTVADPKTGANANTRFQDPASRTDFGGLQEPQWGTPELSNQNINYLQAGDGNPRSPYDRSGTGFVDSGTNEIAPTGQPGSSYSSTSLFLLEPGKETQYVTFAGYVRNSLTFGTFILDGEEVEHEQTIWHLERGAFAFGDATANDSVPTTGSGSYQGSMLASMIFNPTIDGQDISGLSSLPSYFQWIEGTANISVDFAQSSFDLSLDGTVLAPQIDTYTAPAASVLQAGAQFSATGKGDVNLINFGGFKGFIDSANFNHGGQSRSVAIEGSTVDGTFYGPDGEEVGGGFRIVGGNPDERVDIMGAFVGQK